MNLRLALLCVQTHTHTRLDTHTFRHTHLFVYLFPHLTLEFYLCLKKTKPNKQKNKTQCNTLFLKSVGVSKLSAQYITESYSI